MSTAVVPRVSLSLKNDFLSSTLQLQNSGSFDRQGITIAELFNCVRLTYVASSHLLLAKNSKLINSMLFEPCFNSALYFQ